MSGSEPFWFLLHPLLTRETLALLCKPHSTVVTNDGYIINVERLTVRTAVIS